MDNTMNLVWHKFKKGPHPFPPSYDNYYTLTDGELNINYYDSLNFHVTDLIEISDDECSVWLEKQPQYWAEIPKFNLPDELIIENIK